MLPYINKTFARLILDWEEKSSWHPAVAELRSQWEFTEGKRQIPHIKTRLDWIWLPGPALLVRNISHYKFYGAWTGPSSRPCRQEVGGFIAPCFNSPHLDFQNFAAWASYEKISPNTTTRPTAQEVPLCIVLDLYFCSWMAGWMEQWRDWCEKGGGGEVGKKLDTPNLQCKHAGRI